MAGEKLVLLPERAIFWPERKAVLVADVHLGKDVSFRSLGVSVPGSATESSLCRLDDVLTLTEARELYVLGDLWHSRMGRTPEAMDCFLAWRRRWSRMEMTLVEGNHDKLSGALPSEGATTEVTEPFAVGPFSLCHYPDVSVETGYRLAGHVHPSVVLRGKARQAIQLPAFIFGPEGGILPAFGDFTGHGVLMPDAFDKTFVIAGEKVLEARP